MDDIATQGRSLVERRVEESKLAIASEALALAQEFGWDAVTVAQIAARAGVSQRTFHRYFAKKGDVFRPLLDDAALRFCRAFEDSEAGSLSVRTAEALEVSLASYPGGMSAARLAYRLLHDTPALTSVWLEGAFIAEGLFATTLLQSVDRIGSREDAGLLAAVLLAAQRFAIIRWVHGSVPEALHALVVEAIDAVPRFPFEADRT
ncbi:TetR/AcrR family transcriptional regulator [Herbiconiux sp. L3-i23]|uniref:TetR/AcrR family transcriptional regulator n=1 Tax=Herbiconiux sp. L3-i23 TaxID=2905871 RepID=UPI00204F3DC2|nr:TetR/AcrR family transcriptional regulator [Herbiconiux sp. L3-i23]BDI22186.1 hypothetical protein L3i23_09620 [Herbiconiux sp. L3-i23]